MIQPTWDDEAILLGAEDFKEDGLGQQILKPRPPSWTRSTPPSPTAPTCWW